MARKGGYQIVDFKGLKLSTSETTIPGIYETIDGNYDKMLLASGLNFTGTVLPDVPITATVSSNITFTVYGYTVTITSADTVTAAEA